MDLNQRTAGRILSKDSGLGRTKWSTGRGGGRAGDEIRVNRLDLSKNVYLKDIFFRDIFVFGDIFFIAP